MSIQVRLITHDSGLSSHIDKLFKINFKNKCQLTENEEAQVFLFDHSNPDFDAAWNQFLDNHSKDSAIILANGSPTPDALKLEKPININMLWDAIMTSYRSFLSDGVTTDERPKTREAAAALEHSFDSQLDTTVTHASSDEIHYDPDEYFEGYFKRVIATARNDKKMYKAIGLKDQYAAYDPKSNEILTNFQTSHFKNLGIAKIGAGVDVRMEELKTEDYQMLMFDGQVRLHTTEQFLWTIALHTSRGRLPCYIKPETQLGLRFWPNLSRLERPPHIMRVCAVVAEFDLTVQQLPEVLGISPQEAYTCVTAALAIDAMTHDQAVESPKPLNMQQHAKRGLLSAILRKLAS